MRANGASMLTRERIVKPVCSELGSEEAPVALVALTDTERVPLAGRDRIAQDGAKRSPGCVVIKNRESVLTDGTVFARA